MNKIIKETFNTISDKLDVHDYIVIATGASTFFFGFAAPAVLNFYLLRIHYPLVLQYRSSLTFVSSIIGDGLIEPVVNMIAISVVVKNRRKIKKRIIGMGFFIGLLITIYFHVNEAVNGLVNWSMPTPWHWNILGAWHAVYMLLEASLLSVFYLFVIQKKRFAKLDTIIVTIGMILFFVLLRLDYVSVDLTNLLKP